MKTISVIIPVYNTSKYIERCLDSVFNQSMKNLEIIIVNDGSTDNSEEIVKRWIDTHKNTQMKIQYYKKQNGGLSDARNYGMEKATGDYISFIDSDDYIEKDLYKNLKKYINRNIDLIKYRAIIVNEKEEEIERIDGVTFEECTGEEAFKKLYVADKYLEVAWSYLYKRDFFIKNKFKYEKGLYHEDFGLTPFVIIMAQSVISSDYYGYYYVKRENSITDNKDTEKEIKKAYDVLKFYDKAMLKIDKININEKNKLLIKRYYTNSLLLKANSLREEEQKRYIEEIKLRKVYKNIKAENIKQFIKKILIMINIKLYLRMR